MYFNFAWAYVNPIWSPTLLMKYGPKRFFWYFQKSSWLLKVQDFSDIEAISKILPQLWNQLQMNSKIGLSNGVALWNECVISQDDYFAKSNTNLLLFNLNILKKS